MMGLTTVQSDCLAFLKQYSDAKGVMPSYDEIKDHFGWASKSNVHRNLARLQERGHIRMAYNRPRSIELVPDDQATAVVISTDLWTPLIRYCIAERVTVETAVAQFIRDGLESA